MVRHWREFQRRPRRSSSLLIKITKLTIFLSACLFLIISPQTINSEKIISNGYKHFSEKEILSSIKEMISAGKNPWDENVLDGLPWSKDIKVQFTVDLDIQQRVIELFKKSDVEYGAFVAMEPYTGRVISIVSYSREGKGGINASLRASHPAASIYKIITASAAIEEGKLSPYTEILFRGSMYDISPRSWNFNSVRKARRMSLEYAFAKSVNPVFAKVATSIGAETMERYSRNFCFNQKLELRDLDMDISYVVIPEDKVGISKLGAGFGESYMSPLHGAIVAAAIANGGEIVLPYIVESIKDREGRIIYSAKPEVLRRVISPSTAKTIARMMEKTVTIGTSRKAFFDRKKRPYIQGISIAGKTGSLTGGEPKGRCEWFVGFAPLYNPNIAVSVLMVSNGRWKFKSSHMAKEFFRRYFH